MIKVAVFEDNKHLRESLQILLEGTPGLCCSGAFHVCSNIRYAKKISKPNIVLMDIELPGISGIEATRYIKAEYPEVLVLIQTVFYDDEHVFNAICSGASGYILKTTTPAGYIDALMDVSGGGSPMTPGIARRVLELFKTNIIQPSHEEYKLTDKEKTVLLHLVDGKSYKMIASALNISSDTVKTHMKSIYCKLHVNSNTEAVVKAIRERLI